MTRINHRKKQLKKKLINLYNANTENELLSTHSDISSMLMN